MNAMGIRTPYDIIVGRLSRFLGPNTARVAVKTFTDRTIGLEPEVLMRADVPSLLADLLPMLRTLIGRERAEILIRQLLREFQ